MTPSTRQHRDVRVRRRVVLAAAATVALLLAACGQEADGASEPTTDPEAATSHELPTEPSTEEEPMLRPDTATDLTLLEDSLETYEQVRIGVMSIANGVATLDVSLETDSVVGRVGQGGTLQVGDVVVGVDEVRDGVVDAWVDTGHPLTPEEGVTLPIPGLRSFGEEAGLQTDLTDLSLADFAVRTDPDAGLGRGWESVDLELRVGATAELAGYRAEVVAVDEDAAVVVVTAPDGAALPRASAG